jgi:FixJ family two-component response regulator
VLKPAVVVLDKDPARRNSLVRLLFGADWHAEPYENLEELSAFWPRAGIVIAHDDGDMPRRIFEAMIDHDSWQPVVFYAADPAPSSIVDAVLMGASDYLGWPMSESVLDGRLRMLTLRQTSFAQLRQKITHSKRLVASLSRREREVLLSLAAGASNKTIAEELQISPRTIEIHRANMMGKLRARHVGEAITIALYSEMANSRPEDEPSDVPSSKR